MSKTLMGFTGIKDRITIGQVKELIIHSHDEFTRAQLVEIMYRMACDRKYWLYLRYNYDENKE